MYSKKEFVGQDQFDAWIEASNAMRTISPGGAIKYLGIPRTYIYQLIDRGQLESYVWRDSEEGKKRYVAITIDSLQQYEQKYKTRKRGEIDTCKE